MLQALLMGSPGIGKTFLVKALATRMGVTVVRIDFSRTSFVCLIA